MLLTMKRICLTGNFLYLLVSPDLGRMHSFVDLPTLELASVRLRMITSDQNVSSGPTDD